MKSRALTAFISMPVVVLVIYMGGWWYYGAVLAILTITAIEWTNLAAQGGFEASPVLAALAVWLLVLDRALPPDLSGPGLVLLLIGTIAWTVNRHRQGIANSLAGFAFTLAGGLYVGWLGAYLIALRVLPDGLWWMAIALSAVWAADSLAYLVGARWGRHKMIAAASPKKSWEGYVAGIMGSAAIVAGLTFVWQSLGAGPAVKPIHGLVIGLLTGICGPVGDFGISTFKRQVGAKDSGGLLPGHGGFLDRIDALLVAIPLSYYYILLFALK